MIKAEELLKLRIEGLLESIFLKTLTKNTFLKSRCKHVVYVRRQVLTLISKAMLDVSFRVWLEGKWYMRYANAGSMKCFECRYIRHKRILCPLKAWRDEDAGPCTAPEVSEGVIAPDRVNRNLRALTRGEEDSKSASRQESVSDEKAPKEKVERARRCVMEEDSDSE